MIDRFTFIKLLDGEVGQREVIAAEVRGALAAIAGEGRVSVGLPADDSAARWDLSIVIRADDVAAWRAIEARVAAVIDARIAPRAAVVKAWTFATSPG